MMFVFRRNSGARAALIVGCTAALLFSSALPATASDDSVAFAPETAQQENGAIDPTTFEGPLVVATPSGAELVVDVRAGKALEVAEAIQEADRQGSLDTLAIRTSRTGCGQKVRSVGGIANTWATSVQGCAVIGYPGYRRA